MGGGAGSAVVDALAVRVAGFGVDRVGYMVAPDGAMVVELDREKVGLEDVCPARRSACMISGCKKR